MDMPTKIHVAAAKRILRYLKGTTSHGIFYKQSREENLKLVGRTNSDHAGDYDSRRSTSSYAFTMGSRVISWYSKKKPIVTLSTTEIEFVATLSCVCQGVWLKNILKQIK